jgi:RNA polymerase sigma factor (TIGR02999 family)
MSDVTRILEKINAGGDPHAADELLSVVYNELRVIAKSKMEHERPGHTLQPTILVHDAWLKLFPEGQNPKFKGRAHFFGAAARAMHRILVDHARRKYAKKRGGDFQRVDLSDAEFAEIAHPAPTEMILAVDEALKRFAEMDKTTTDLVELRFFVGMNMEEAAAALGIPERSGERLCAYFTTWFRREFGKDLNI